MRLFFENSGGPCWIVSVGNIDIGPKLPDQFAPVWDALKRESEPTLVVIPDAVLLVSSEDYKSVWDLGFAHCVEMRNRFAILDVYNCDRSRDDPRSDVIADPETGFRSLIESDALSYGAA